MAHSNSNNPAGWAKNISDSMKSSAASRQCENCKRKGAMGKVIPVVDMGIGFKECRFCGHIEKVAERGEGR